MEEIKGEFVIVVAGNDGMILETEELGVVEQVQFYIDQGIRKMDAIKMVAQERNLKKNEVYAEYHREEKE